MMQPVIYAEAEPKNNIILYNGENEMLRVAKEGFYVRGKPIPIDDEEAMAVYRAFRSFLVYHGLTRD